MFSRKCRILMLWLFYFILLHILSFKTVKAEAYSSTLECYECYSHEKQCDSPIDTRYLPRTLCGRYTHNSPDGVYNDYDNTFLKRAFPFFNITSGLQQYQQQQQQYNMQVASHPRDKRQIDMYYNQGYSCLKIQVTGKESGTIRGCTPDQTDVCKLAKQLIPPQLRISSCEICKKDLCNGATTLSLSIFMIISTIIMNCTF